MNTQITNNGRWAEIQIAEAGSWITFPEKGNEVSVADAGKHGVKVTPDLRIGVRNYVVSDQLTAEEIVTILAPLGLEFRMYTKDMPISRVFYEEDGSIVPSDDVLLQLTGLKDPEMDIRYYRVGGFIFRSHASGVFNQDTVWEPYLEKDVRKAVNIKIAQANRWLHQNLRSFKRVVRPTAEQAIRIYNLAQRSRIHVISVKAGDTINVRRYSGQKFGSGGSWARWEEFGNMSTEIVADNSNKFIDNYTVAVTFDQGPAVLHTAAGDGIGNGRLHFSELYVVSPSGELAEKLVVL